MATSDLALWLLAGISAGALAGAITPGAPLLARLATLAAGALGAVLGGWIAGGLSGISAIAFLGAVCISVPAAVLSSILLQCYLPTRYHR